MSHFKQDVVSWYISEMLVKVRVEISMTGASNDLSFPRGRENPIAAVRDCYVLVRQQRTSKDSVVSRLSSAAETRRRVIAECNEYRDEQIFFS